MKEKKGKLKEKPTSIAIPQSFSFTVRRQLKRFMFIVGIHEGHPTNHLLNVYNFVIISFLIFATLRRSFQVWIRPPGALPIPWRKAIFDPHCVLAFTRALFVFSGVTTSLLHRIIKDDQRRFFSAIDEVIGESKEKVEKGKRMTRNLILLTIGIVLTVLLLECLAIYGFVRYHWIPPLFTESIYFTPLEIYAVLLAQCSITLCVVDFYQCCSFLRFGIDTVAKMMREPLSFSSQTAKLQHLEDIQSQYHKVLTAKNLLEKCYGMSILCFYLVALPIVCFLAYVGYRNVEDHESMISSIAIWIMLVLFKLLILNSAAFSLHEEGEALLTTVFDMYHTHLKEGRDSDVRIEMQLLVTQIQSNKLSISACDYFPLNRQIVITICSAIFTYFLILVQFSGDQTKEFSTHSFSSNVSV